MLAIIIVTWWSGAGGIQALSERATGFLQCFVTVGLVIWPIKIVPDMTYNVFGGVLNLAQSIMLAVICWSHTVLRLSVCACVIICWKLLNALSYKPLVRISQINHLGAVGDIDKLIRYLVQ